MANLRSVSGDDKALSLRGYDRNEVTGVPNIVSIQHLLSSSQLVVIRLFSRFKIM